MTKYCVNCKHFRPKEEDVHYEYARCAVSKRETPISLVTGKPKYVDRLDLPYAEVMRVTGQSCGPDALFFEEKDKPKYLPPYNSAFVKGDE